jgi:hypothetical protein
MFYRPEATRIPHFFLTTKGDGGSWDTSRCSARVQGGEAIIVSKTLEKPSNDATTTRRW